MADAGKAAKSAVRYSLGGDHCGVCRFFQGKRSEYAKGPCAKVEGDVEADYWCKLFKRLRTTIAGGK